MMDEENQIGRSLHEFTQETSMHGIRYVKMEKVSLVRRFGGFNIMIDLFTLYKNFEFQRLIKFLITK